MVKEFHDVSSIKGNLKEFVVNYIREQIFQSRGLRPGDRINERELSRTLDISRAPIREALKELEEQGLVSSIQYKGWFVTEYHEEAFWEITKLRTLLEYTVLEKVIAMGGPSPEEISHLELLNRELQEIVDDPDLGDNKLFIFCDKEMEFHMYLCSLAKDHCFWTQKIHRNLSYQIRCSFEICLHHVEQLKDSIVSHDVVIQCLKRKDLANLRQEMFRKLQKRDITSLES
ncbi:GntR family transcriptional regulator [Lutispora saccharofermentans]|uniref:GntR family transcriptional regulator n=1 Tax=Lutispora saccharofermentans TaxID=3024236 RepID=A0ABT1NCF1_9FIRM|nr:GntR family transcriptional regulator [Lutispora saccharofermentans]MCQ1528938.1 GntR family transcriptional regulator [Lutispora saccharofermentans]